MFDHANHIFLLAGYDIVRWGNIDEVAFFHVRTEPVTDQRLVLAKQAVDVLRQVARVFDYQAYFVCLFYQKDAVSRFVEQRLLFNIYPLEEHMRKNNVRDLSTDPSAFAYLYFYGLFVHKLGHFFDIGTLAAFTICFLSAFLTLSYSLTYQ